MAGKQTLKQEARLRARAARGKVQQENAERDRRLARLGEAVTVALAERDELVNKHERRAGAALRSMIEEEGLSARQALDWCGVEALSTREAQRLIRAANEEGEGLGEGSSDTGEVAESMPG